MNRPATYPKKASLIPITMSSIAAEAIEKLNGATHSTAYDKFLNSILDQQKEYPAPIPVISIVQNDKTLPFLTLKSFSLWQGKQKSKKTTALALIISSFIEPNRYDSGIYFKSNIEGKVIWFDNEQGESYAARTMRLILSLSGNRKSDKLIYSDLREFSPNERLEIIREAIKQTPGVRLVVIDGLVDLLTDFMDSQEGHTLTTEILKLCSQHDIHIAGVLHQNKNDKNARAHIGTISSQKCEIEISTEVDTYDRSQSNVICVNSRGLPFDTFSIRWDAGSLPCICHQGEPGVSLTTKANMQLERSREIAEAIFKPFAALSHADAIKAIMNATGKSESTAKRTLKDFQLWDFITKSEDGLYRIFIKKGSRVHEGSNEVHEPGSDRVHSSPYRGDEPEPDPSDTNTLTKMNPDP